MTRKLFAATLAIGLALMSASWWFGHAPGTQRVQVGAHRALGSLLARDSLAKGVAAPDSLVRRSVPAALVLHINDCGSNLRYLRLLAPQVDAPFVQVQRIVVASALADSMVIRASLPQWLSAVPLVAMTPVVTRALHDLGHSTSPILIVGDPMARVRLVTQAPRTSWEYTGFRKLVEALTWYEEM